MATMPWDTTVNGNRAGSTNPLLGVNNLVLDFGGLRALDGASLNVGRGTITGLIGPNGAGKTTLFNVITGYLEPRAGRVFLDGEDITALPPHRIFERGLCRTFQIPREHGSMSVLENLMLVPRQQAGESFFASLLRPGRVRAQEQALRADAERVLEMLELSHLAHEYARNLSGGQKKLLELARTLMANPKLVLLDEPGAGVNPTLMDRLRENIERLNAEHGITFLIIEHDMDLVMRLCNPVIVMSEGRYLMEGPPEAVRTDARVLEAYLGGQHAATES
ncbi:ABC transporter ATP-binding protein [Aquisalimonas sp.]|uniref:ABC transporter ATP-binding protein n=1 Tax=Aquisalimonas sp. TaxID=1872621 RepID=UPI0025C02E6B|nr:ABC transporter ATP-binding protein [Aquisalimonas sp.]